jgi:hypothetical protein
VPVPTVEEAGCPPEPVWTLCRRDYSYLFVSFICSSFIEAVSNPHYMTSNDSMTMNVYGLEPSWRQYHFNEVVSGGQPCQCGVGVRHFRDCSVSPS